MASEIDKISAQLEAIIDKIGLKLTIDLIAEICDDKAEHIAVEWQDARGAKFWARAARKLDVLQYGLDP